MPMGPALLALCFGVLATAQASVRSSGLARILHVTRPWQAGDQGQGTQVGVISGGASNFRVLARHQILSGDVGRFGRRHGRGDEGDWMTQVGAPARRPPRPPFRGRAC